MIRSALTKTQIEAVENPGAAKVLVVSLNKEISIKNKEIEGQKVTIQDTQDELEIWRERYHASNRDNGILSSRQNTFVLLELLKLISSAVGVGYGLTLLSISPGKGTIWISVSVIMYTLLTIFQKKK
jgi:hypothetical protein